MSTSQCPLCSGLLEVRKVTPCFICGGWPSAIEAFDSSARLVEWRLPSGSTLVLCASCQLEEFMVPHGWGEELIGDRAVLPISALVYVKEIGNPSLVMDKFCPECNMRLALIRIAVEIRPGQQQADGTMGASGMGDA